MFRKFLKPIHKKLLSHYDDRYSAQTFEQLITQLSLRQLSDSAMYYQLEFNDKTSKEELIRLLTERFHKENSLYYEMLIHNEAEFHLLRDALSAHHNAFNLSSDDMEQMTAALIVFDVDDQLILPSDTFDALIALPLDKIEQKKEKYEQDFTFITSNLMLYGFLTRDHLESHYKKVYHTSFEPDSIDLFLSIYDIESHNGFIVDTLLDSWVDDKGDYQDLRSLPYYEFQNQREVYDYVGPDHHLQTLQMKSLSKFLKKKTDLSPDEWDQLIESIQVYTMGAPDYESAREEISSLVRGMFSREERNTFNTLYQDMFNHTRQWMLAGHTPVEIEEMIRQQEEIKHSLKTNKIVTLNDIKAAKKD
ncbi:hypothetical protein ERX37_06840 [Macrococcus hajekii]|uniref:Uncharacterized protein n=1 Tax=Macrococcus hajekii TaxID=198482 RepID=A0A4R6BK30_9STAP|nr:hypothetical protein [Macrococcus hajekii]TDM01921.1 hypothetical protein ERX37_06840 [Macrococcus hajekii]GGB08577.1 hypothetical protein GCM10007190_15710 [Macrococcus hajekii]